MFWLPGVIGVITAALTLVLVSRERSCASCGQPLGRLRSPRSVHEALWGGWTCPDCGAQLNRKGEVRR